MAEGKFVWSITATKLLISEYEAFELLYDSKNINYKNRNKRLDAYRSIAETVNTVSEGCTVEDVKKKLNGLRSQYLAEKMKVLRSKKSGARSDDLYKPTVYWFPLLTFLDKSTDPDQSQSNLDESLLSPNESQSTSSTTNIIAPPDDDQDTNSNLSIRLNEESSVLPPKIRKIQKFSHNSVLTKAANTMEEMSKIARERSVSKATQDSLETFGQFVVAELRGIQGASNEYTVRKTKRKIQMVLMEAWDMIDQPTLLPSPVSSQSSSNQWILTTQTPGACNILQINTDNQMQADGNTSEDVVENAIHMANITRSDYDPACFSQLN
ncbi:unnamed protein product [Acanthoscelides obtectus]|uniref:MADF domain-containing protein n=1 Tax=Acanthoscelides obtectus TaxID=200917 RepID=A0A9P0PU47_ACAOB|nr:unnamed protein product [Acanthoscelides obtectus]CAK1627127.1 hypothetical protein AOBTE_LOCUS4324 [Acanthoscelides obtectus]